MAGTRSGAYRQVSSGKDEVLEKLVERIKLDSFSRNTEAGRGGVGLPAV